MFLVLLLCLGLGSLLPHMPMGKTAVCTISTQSHVFKSKALLSSVRRYSSADLFCLLTDSDSVPASVCDETYHTLDVLSGSLAYEIKKKYRGNKLRWSCKPLYISYLLKHGYNSVIYVDNDIYFFSSPDFIVDELEHASVLLTPHYYSASPEKEQNWLEANFRVGLYNAGFIGVSTGGLSAMEWWAACCLYNVKQSAWRGLFDDQKYLDLMPINFEGVKILKHKGCNVAGWNIEQCPRTQVNGQWVIDGKFPIVFIHFAALTFRNVLAGKDAGLSAFFKEYIAALKKQNPAYSEDAELRRTYNDYLLYFRHLRWRITRFFE